MFFERCARALTQWVKVPISTLDKWRLIPRPTWWDDKIDELSSDLHTWIDMHMPTDPSPYKIQMHKCQDI